MKGTGLRGALNGLLTVNAVNTGSLGAPDSIRILPVLIEWNTIGFRGKKSCGHP